MKGSDAQGERGSGPTSAPRDAGDARPVPPLRPFLFPWQPCVAPTTKRGPTGGSGRPARGGWCGPRAARTRTWTRPGLRTPTPHATSRRAGARAGEGEASKQPGANMQASWEVRAGPTGPSAGGRVVPPTPAHVALSRCTATLRLAPRNREPPWVHPPSMEGGGVDTASAERPGRQAVASVAWSLVLPGWGKRGRCLSPRSEQRLPSLGGPRGRSSSLQLRTCGVHPGSETTPRCRL